MNNKTKSLTIVIPFLNEAENLKKLPERISKILTLLPNIQIQFLLVDDGSTDESSSIIKTGSFHCEVKLIRLAKNYGSHYAMLAALDNCDTDYFTFMSSDFQEPAELFRDLVAAAETGKSDIILGARENRNVDFWGKISSRLFNWLVGGMVFKGFPENGVDIFLINRKCMNILRGITEKNTSIYGLLFSTGLSRSFVPYRQLSRKHGKSKWSLGKKLKLFLDTFVSFTVLPLRLISVVGFLFSFVGAIHGLYVIVSYFQGKITVMGFPTIISLLTFGFGLVFLMLAILAEYIWRMFDQVRPRPRYIIDEIVSIKSKLN